MQLSLFYHVDCSSAELKCAWCFTVLWEVLQMLAISADGNGLALGRRVTIRTSFGKSHLCL